METLGNRISRLRRTKGYTQEQFAEILGVSAQAVSKWENDLSCPDITLLPKISELLGLSVDELLKGEAPPKAEVLPEDKRKDIKDMQLRVIVTHTNGQNVNVRVPMVVVKTAAQLGTGVQFMGLGDTISSIDLNMIFNAIENGTIGKIVDVVTENGDHVEVIVE
ncbi:MAG: helix-turn-helix transcriptional regulator [Clostridia bacterium]|nr:helix-turn-helix transcriptional regulator [Clostridia bacterium]